MYSATPDLHVVGWKISLSCRAGGWSLETVLSTICDETATMTTGAHPVSRVSTHKDYASYDGDC
jgi:hypothetical protein